MVANYLIKVKVFYTFVNVISAEITKLKNATVGLLNLFPKIFLYKKNPLRPQ